MRHRLILRWVGALFNGGFTAATVYLYDKLGPSDPANLEILHTAAGLLKALGRPWILGGDFNTTPDLLAHTGFPLLADGHIVAPP